MYSASNQEKGKNNETMNNYNEIGKQLLEDKLYLTALELYTELLECGKELKDLKDFFANPGNFEQQIHDFPTRLSRSGSQVTLDSLDLTRYSEDGERGMDEKIAVLEFELRKAKETISALRNNLTVATECESNTPVQMMHNTNIMPHEQRALNFLINEYLLSYGYKLTSITFADENEDQDFDDWDDVGLNVSKPIGLLALYREGLKRTGSNTESNSCQTELVLYSENDIKKYVKEIAELNSKIIDLQNKLQDIQEENKCLITENEVKFKNENNFSDVSQNVLSSKSSTTSSATPECFEIITTEDNTSVSSLNEHEWIKLEENKISVSDNKKLSIIDLFHQKVNGYFLSSSRKMSLNWSTELLTFYPVNIPRKSDNIMFDNIAHLSYSFESLVQTLSSTLLRIIPNILLNKREDVVALLVSTICLSPNSNVRDKLLQLLFNLKKKPNLNERSIILAGIIKIANHLPQDVVESELLSLCCEQLSNKHKEKRLLICETCIILVPYISTPMRHSLLFSILQQMFEDSDESVRILVVKAMSLVAALCDDIDKFNNSVDFSLKFVNDECDSVFQVTHYILYPILAEWGLHNATFEILFKKLLNFYKESASNDQLTIKIYKVLNHLLPFMLVFVCNTEVICKEIDEVMDINPDIASICSKMNNPQIFYNGAYSAGAIIHQFQEFIKPSVKEQWHELKWILILISDLIVILDESCIRNNEVFSIVKNFFSNLCATFGKTFTKQFIRPIFENNIKSLTDKLSTVHKTDLNFSILPIYLVSVLNYCQDNEEILNTLKKFCFAIPLCGMSILCLEISIKELCNIGLQESVLNCLWDAVVHQQPIVRANAGYLFKTLIPLCDGNLLYSKVVPALVTLANDSDMSVRIQIIPALGYLITDCDIKNVHDKAYMMLQSFFVELNYNKNHGLLKQLITTMGLVSTNCSESFLYDVIVTQLVNITNHVTEIENIPRRSDIIESLKEAFAGIVYSNLNNKTLSSALLPALRYLENAVNDDYKDVICSMVKECENRMHITSSSTQSQRNLITDNVNSSMEEVRNRMTKMFNKSALPNRNSLSNVQSLFKKK